MTDAVELVGPKGYEHGWHYVGGPGLPSVEPSHSHSGHPSGRRSAPRIVANKTEPGRMQDMINARPHASSGRLKPGPFTSGRFTEEFRQSSGTRKAGVDLGGHKPESAEGRRRALAAGHALPPRHPGGTPGYPVTDAKHWEKARDAVGRSGGGARRRALAKLLAKTAPEFGKSVKGTWIEQELSGASMSNVYGFASSFIPNPSKEQWAEIDARRGVSGGDEDKSDQHVKAAKSAFTSGQHGDALSHLQQAHALTSNPAKKAQIEGLHKKLAGTALQAGTIRAMSNGRTAVEYNLAARYHALNFGTDETPEYGSDSAAQHSLTHDHDGYGTHTHNFASQHSKDSAMPKSGGSSASGTSLDKSPGELRTPTGGSETQGAGFRPASAGLTVRSRSGNYGSMSNGAGHGIELARRQVTSASDIVVSRGADGSAVIRHRRGGDTIGTIGRLASGQWGGKVEGGSDLTPHTHQRAALQELLGTWNKAQVTPFRPAMPLQQAPAQTELMTQFGVTNVRALATPATGASSGARVTGYANDGDSDDNGGSGPAGMSPKGVSIYKKLIARGFPAARALAFARRAESFGQKAS